MRARPAALQLFPRRGAKTRPLILSGHGNRAVDFTYGEAQNSLALRFSPAVATRQATALRRDADDFILEALDIIADEIMTIRDGQ
jgi:hypothetical protein